MFHIQHSSSRIPCKTIFKGRVGRSERPKRERQELHKYKSYHVTDNHCLLNHGDYGERYKLDKPFSSTLRWLKTVSSTLKDVDFDGALLPLFIS